MSVRTAVKVVRGRVVYPEAEVAEQATPRIRTMAVPVLLTRARRGGTPGVAVAVAVLARWVETRFRQEMAVAELVETESRPRSPAN